MSRVVAVYEYANEKGELRFCKVRYEPKDFRWGEFCRWDGDVPVLRPGIAERADEWNATLYRLPEVVAALRVDVPIAIAEGEKDATSLAALGMVATTATNPVAPRLEQAEWLTRYGTASDVLLAVDQDSPGARSGWRWYQNLLAVGVEPRRITVITPKRRTHKDVTDVLEAGLGIDGFRVVDLDRLERAAIHYGQASPRSRPTIDAPYPGLAFERGYGWFNPQTDYVVASDPGWYEQWRANTAANSRPRRGGGS
jgi:hypothetical protein